MGTYPCHLHKVNFIYKHKYAYLKPNKSEK